MIVRDFVAEKPVDSSDPLPQDQPADLSCVLTSSAFLSIVFLVITYNAHLQPRSHISRLSQALCGAMPYSINSLGFLILAGDVDNSGMLKCGHL